MAESSDNSPDTFFTLPKNEGSNKVCSLSDAIRKYIRPGMIVHLGSTHARPNGFIYELARQFHGKKPGFTFVSAGFIANSVILLHLGLVKKIISTFCGDNYPYPGPNPVVQRAYTSGTVEFENWSILTLPLRLMAGAMGVPFMPTKSLIGSTMERDNRGSFFVLHRGKDVMGMVKALHPDITLMHGIMGDRNGNIVLTPPYGADVHGALASRRGVLVSVEKIVSTEEVRRHAHMVRIPGHIVRAVCPAPFGAHPSGLSGQGVHVFVPYADDYEFIEEARSASRDPEVMDRWIKTWVLECRTHEDYITRLGSKRIRRLTEKADPESWRADIIGFPVGHGDANMPPESEARPAERMAVMGGRRLCEKIGREGYSTILAGIGVSNLSAWLAHYWLKAQGNDIELMAETGFYGYAPRPGDPFIFNLRNVPTCKMLSSTETIMGVLLGGEPNRCIGAIGAGQIDWHGNINTTMIPGRLYLTGSGGGNDICSSAAEVLVTAFQGKGRFLKKVPYITSPGTRVKTLVSDLGVFEKNRRSDTLTLTGYFPIAPEEEALREIKEKCGWPFKAVRKPERLALPSQEELRLLRFFDPKGLFLS